MPIGIKVSVKKGGPGTRDVKADLAELRRSEILVGIPADKTVRKAGEINNATLAFIHERGSALRGIPARPFLRPGIHTMKREITQEMALGAKELAAGHAQQARTHMLRAGMLGANAAKRYVLEGSNLAPNAPSTIARKGSSRPLVDSSQMIRSVTAVIKER